MGKLFRNKFENLNLKKWAETSVNIRNRGEEPNLIHLEEWLQRRVQVLQEIEPKDEKSPRQPNRREQLEEKKKKILSTQINTKSCPTCGGKHLFWKCETYKSLNPNKRFDAVKKMKRCFNCFGAGHEVPSCTSKITCFVADCKEKHHTTLHDHFTASNANGNNNGNVTPSSADGTSGQSVTVSHTVGGPRSKCVFLQIVPVKLYSKAGKSIHTYGLLDNAADATLLRDDLARKLKIKGKADSIWMNTVKDDPEQVDTERITFEISAKDGTNRFTATDAFAVPADKFRMPSRPSLVPCDDEDFFTHLDNIDLDANRVKLESLSVQITRELSYPMISGQAVVVSPWRFTPYLVGHYSVEFRNPPV